jgi:putative ABC transport system substrate-binding protein
MRRREVIGLIGAAAAWPFAAGAQQPRGLPKIGFLFLGPEVLAVPRSALLLEGLRRSGFDAAGHAILLTRATDGDPARLAPQLADLLANKVDVLVPLGPQAVRAARAATSTIPIVTFDLESDPVEEGLLGSFAHPGGNITGVFLDFPDFGRVWLQFLKEAVPDLSKLVVLWDPSTPRVQTRAVAAAAENVGVKIEVLQVDSPNGLDGVFEAASARSPDGLLVLSSPIMSIFSKQIAALTVKHRLPAISLFANFARSGGLMAYGPDLDELYRKTGFLVGRILKGAVPADIPAERPDRFELILNVTTARELGLTIPNSLLARADEVIE